MYSNESISSSDSEINVTSSTDNRLVLAEVDPPTCQCNYKELSGKLDAILATTSSQCRCKELSEKLNTALAELNFIKNAQLHTVLSGIADIKLMLQTRDNDSSPVRSLIPTSASAETFIVTSAHNHFTPGFQTTLAHNFSTPIFQSTPAHKLPTPAYSSLTVPTFSPVPTPVSPTMISPAIWTQTQTLQANLAVRAHTPNLQAVHMLTMGLPTVRTHAPTLQALLGDTNPPDTFIHAQAAVTSTPNPISDEVKILLRIAKIL